MQKTLIIIIVVILSYILIDRFSTNEDSIEPIDNQPSVKLSSKPSEKGVKPEPLYKIDKSDTPETDVFGSEFIEGTYSAKLDNERTKANLQFSFYKDGTFIDNRTMTFPKSLAGETSGTYTIEGETLSLIYSEVRDTKVFTFSKASMALHKDGTLRTGTVVLTKQ